VHPQTILAYDMNGKQLTVPHGAPLRLRLERQLGYKMAKCIMRIELVQSLADLHGGRGGYWEIAVMNGIRGSERYLRRQSEVT
jgi:DMSO/TMAO reductase YedYZ molybdopterin-dependent catalytic subunit